MAAEQPSTQQPPFDNIINFRDVAKSIDNPTGQALLKPGLLYRSARPDAASRKDRDLLTATYKIHTIVDLRTQTEHLEARRKFSDSQYLSTAPAVQPTDPKRPLRIPGIEYRDIDFNGRKYSNHLLKQLSWRDSAKLYSLYVCGYRKQAISVLCSNVMAPRGLTDLTRDTLAYSRHEVKAYFDILASETSYPVLVHCTQGKDRTGLAILLALVLCGVPLEAVERDYRLSEKELEVEREERLRELAEMGLPESFAKCPEEWARVTVKEYLDEGYGGVEKYLEGCGIGKEQQEVVKGILIAKAQ